MRLHEISTTFLQVVSENKGLILSSLTLVTFGIAINVRNKITSTKNDIIVLVSGKRFAGKDTFCNELLNVINKQEYYSNHFNCTDYSMADQMKRVYCDKTGANLHKMLTDRNYKEEYRADMTKMYHKLIKENYEQNKFLFVKNIIKLQRKYKQKQMINSLKSYCGFKMIIESLFQVFAHFCQIWVNHITHTQNDCTTSDENNIVPVKRYLIIIRDFRRLVEKQFFEQEYDAKHVITVRIKATNKTKRDRGWIFDDVKDRDVTECELDSINHGDWNFVFDNDLSVKHMSIWIENVFLPFLTNCK